MYPNNLANPHSLKKKNKPLDINNLPYTAQVRKFIYLGSSKIKQTNIRHMAKVNIKSENRTPPGRIYLPARNSKSALLARKSTKPF